MEKITNEQQQKTKKKEKTMRTRRLKWPEIVKVIILESSPIFGRRTEIERQSVLLFYKNKYKFWIKCY